MSLLDTEQITAMSGGMPELLLPILEDFHGQARDSLAGLAEALSEGRLPDAGGLLHQLKGASGSLGLLRFHELCAAGEQAAKAGREPPHVGELPGLLEESVTAARTFLNG